MHRRIPFIDLLFEMIIVFLCLKVDRLLLLGLCVHSTKLSVVLGLWKRWWIQFAWGWAIQSFFDSFKTWIWIRRMISDKWHRLIYRLHLDMWLFSQHGQLIVLIQILVRIEWENRDLSQRLGVVHEHLFYHKWLLWLVACLYAPQFVWILWVQFCHF